MYSDITIDTDNLSAYPSEHAGNNTLPGIRERVVINHTDNSDKLYAEETSGLECHPSHTREASEPDNNVEAVYLEHTGVYDADGVSIPGREKIAAALQSLSTVSHDLPDLILPRATNIVKDYANPALFPGMFPTLFPYGLGGFDDASRAAPLTFRAQVEYFLDCADPRFRRHRSFVFVALNIHQRHLSHLHTAFAIRKSRFTSIATRLEKISAATLESVARHIRNEQPDSDLSPDEKDVFMLTKEFKTISAKIPGSNASKLEARNEIRAYMGYFGLPTIYMTLNPNAAHSPIFQFLYGDDAVDLVNRFPSLVSSVERGIRVASDPAKGEEFFSLLMHRFFEHLLGWDHSAGKSSSKGGILGKLNAFYGTAEFTERGQLHGHFLIWLDGALNPADVHKKMIADRQPNNEPGPWTNQFFEFFEDIMRHDLPPGDNEVDAAFEPRTQRPPNPQSAEFDSIFPSELRKCVAALQLHKSPCLPVCFKYGSEECRFGFPHETVSKSSFNPDDNSITFKVTNPMVNWYNPWISVFCRHNHDIKCILGGKSAKAAMMYITDYITKNDEKLYEMLSLFSRSVAAKSDSDSSGLSDARQLLHTCLNASIREQKIHAQQAVRYLRGKTDSMCSHKTAPMFSSTLLYWLRQVLAEPRSVAELGNSDSDSEDEDGSEDDAGEEAAMKVEVQQSGRLALSSQVDDYLFRDSCLSTICFYDFVRCYKKVSRSSNALANKKTTFKLNAPHHQSNTHILRQICDPSGSSDLPGNIPRVVGSSIPRKHDEANWAMFVVAHFLPFQSEADFHGLTLASIEAFYNQALRDKKITERSTQICDNWEAIHECEDERDAERLRKKDVQRKKAARAQHSENDDNNLPESFYANPEDFEGIGNSEHISKQNRDWSGLVQSLVDANWLHPDNIRRVTSSLKESPGSLQMQTSLPDPSTYLRLLPRWKKQIVLQSTAAESSRRRCSSHQQDLALPPEAQVANQLASSQRPCEDPNPALPEAEVMSKLSGTITSQQFDADVKSLSDTFGLNKQQNLAFRICAKRFKAIQFPHLVAKPSRQLKMFMTGPGGTGKSYAVNALAKLMETFNCAHLIRFLAPTAAAAIIINGMTIHKGLGISIHATSSEQRRKLNDADLFVQITAEKRVELRLEWKQVQFLLIDEVSMVSAQLLCELDCMLRFAREDPVTWFGGVNIIFAGDFHQLPPVLATPLYNAIPVSLQKQSAKAVMAREGRMAWKQVDVVVNFTEQQRMRTDPSYAEAVLRLRQRNCTESDVAMFNTRVIKSAYRPHGLDLHGVDLTTSTTLVEDNLTRCEANSAFIHNLEQSGSDNPRIYRCYAQHKKKAINVDAHLQSVCLQVDDRDSPALVDLYIGARVILRKRNLSTELNIANGSIGYVRGIHMIPLPNGTYHAPLAVVHFPDSTVQLDGLPQGYFPIQAVSKSIPIVLRDKITGRRYLQTMTRWQLPLQLATASTIHGAQGRTLLQVISNLNYGGAKAYVVASRPRSLEGLILTEPVSLAKLNTRLDTALLLENARLDALAHNTSVDHDPLFSDTPKRPIPDTESLPTKVLRLAWQDRDIDVSTAQGDKNAVKRVDNPSESQKDTGTGRSKKKRRLIRSQDPNVK